MPNDPQNVAGISYVFVLFDELKELLVTEFNVSEDEINPRSGKHSYMTSAGFDSYTPSDETESEDLEEIFDDTAGGEYGEFDTDNETTDDNTEAGNGEFEDPIISEPEPEIGFDPEPQPEPEPEPDSSIYEEYPDAAGVPLD